MSDFKRWTDDESDATATERPVLEAGKDLSLGAARKAELRRALAIAITLPAPPDGGPGDGRGGGSPPPAAPPAVPPPGVAETATALGGVGKVLFSGKLSGALAAFVLAAGGTAAVLGATTLTTDTKPTASAQAPVATIVKQADDVHVAAMTTASVAAHAGTSANANTTSSAEATPVATPRPARSSGEKAAAAAEEPALAVPAPVPSGQAPNAPAASVAPPPSGAVLVIPSAPDSRLAEESARVRAAREALRSGNGASTLSLLDAIDREFGGGVLGQEREALRIEALAALGRTTEARVRADVFLKRHPGSAFASSVGRFATAR